MTNRLLFCWLLLLPLSLAWTQAAPPAEEPEAPAALFDQKLGDVGVVVEAEGTWTSRLAGGWGLGWGTEGLLPALGYPGLEKGGVFVQQPDFSLTLRLFERYYVSVVFTGSLKDRSFLLGYQGQPGEVLRWVKLGNAAFSLPARAGQEVADGRPGAPAAGAAAQWSGLALEGLARYEDGTRETRVFRGYREASSLEVGLDEWIRGRFFRVPTPGVTGLRVAVLDGLTYRPALASEAEVTVQGEIILAAPASRRFAVTWDGAAPFTTPLLQLAAEEIVAPELVGGPWFLLAGPGVSTAFEVRNRYPVTALNEGLIRLVDRATGLSVTEYSVGQASALSWFDVSGPAEAPFFASLPGLYPTGTAAPIPSPALPWVFQLPSGPAKSALSLGSDVLASSLVVVRNGVATTAFRFEASSGELTLDTPVYETDTLEVSFQRLDAARKAADLFLWQAGRWDLADQQSLEWALQGRWNMENGSWTTQDLQSPGRAALSLAYQGRAGDWQWRAEGTAGTLLADSTGHRRLFGQANEGATVVWNSESLRPSAAPGSLEGFTLTQATRAPLAYRNYWSNDALTGGAELSTWGKPGIDREPAGPGGWVGPYLVRGDGSRSDRLAVLEGDPARDEWMGLQAYFDQGKPRDLRSTSALSVTFRVPGGANGRLILQAGTVSEDWDGTGTVKRVEYKRQPALAFYAEGEQQFFPVPEDSRWANDGDGDGVPSPDGTLVTRGWSVTADEGWTTKRFVLTDAERQALARSTGWRLVYVEGSGGSTRTVLVGPVVFEGSSWSVKPLAGAPLDSSVNPVEEADPADASRRQLRLDWSKRPNWTVEGLHAPLRPSSYRTLSFLYRLTGSPTPTTLTLGLSDREGRGLWATWTPVEGPGWSRAVVHLDERSLQVDGTTTGSVTLVSGAESWDRLTLTQAGWDAGELVLADIEATDPVWQALGSSLVTTTWTQASPWPSPDFPLLGGMVWTLASRQEGLTAADAVWHGQTDVSATLGPLKTTAEASFTQTAQGPSTHAAYEANLPWDLFGVNLQWTDRFSDLGSRSERLLVRLPWLGSWEVQAAVAGPPSSLDQSYTATWNSEAAEKAPWSAQTNLRWLQSTPRYLPLEGFGPVWLASWRWLEPGSAIAPYHLLGLDGLVKATMGDWVWQVRDRNQASQSQGNEGKWSAWGDWSTQAAYHWGDVGTVTPSLSRSFEGVYGGRAPLAPDASALQALSWLWTGAAAATGLPFGELYAEAWLPGDETFRSGKTATEVGLAWERPSRSDWKDIVTPSVADFKARTARGRDGQADFRTQSLSARLQARALNLWGTLGSSPFFEWYRTDVWSWSTAATWNLGTRDQDRSVGTDLQVRSELILTPDESLVLPVVYQAQWQTAPTHTLQWAPSWSLRGPANLPFELPRWLSPSSFRRQWVQDLGMSLQWGWQPLPTPVLRDLQVTWKGRLLMSEKSEIDLTAKWGQQWQKGLTVVGLEAALDLILAF